MDIRQLRGDAGQFAQRHDFSIDLAETLAGGEDFSCDDDVVGIVFPVYYATSPKMIREFLKEVNITTDYLFLICSYGSDGDQNALKIMAKTLKKKGINVNYTNSVLMVDNYLPLFDIDDQLSKLPQKYLFLNQSIPLR